MNDGGQLINLLVARELSNVLVNLIRPRIRRHRRIFHQYFQQRNLGIFDHFQKKMAITLLDQLSVSPNDFLSHIGQ